MKDKLYTESELAQVPGEARASNALRVAVVGASGYIGTNLVPKLVARGFHVRATARSREVLEGRRWPGVEIAVADVLTLATLTEALEGIDVAYYLVHSLGTRDDVSTLEQKGADNFAEAAANAGLRRIVYLGGLIPENADSQHLVSRRLTGERLRQGRVPVTEIRAGIIVGPGSYAFEVIRDLVNHLPVMVTPRWVKVKSPPIALENLLEYLLRVAELDEAAGQIYDAAGPEMLSYEELMLQYGECVGKRPFIIPVPVLTPKLSSYWLRAVTSVPTSIAHALIAGLKLDIKADDSTLRSLVPQHLLTYREAVAAVFDAERRNAVAAHWTEGVLMFRDYNPNYAYYAKKASGTALAKSSLESVWAQVAAIGGENRYYFANFLWTLREFFDWSIGGQGLNRGRRHPVELRVGDTIDSWRVIGVEPPRRLTLGFGMKAPGAGVLEFAIKREDPQHTRITVTAYWHPAGVWGLMYWYVFSPSHFLVFNGMARAIAERAQAAQDHDVQASDTPSSTNSDGERLSQ
jgi:uncharacterized protein YbjT (DUF2867 family)